MEPWIQTYTGRQFWPLNPKSEDVCIEDIAHALAFKCRFGGHCKTFYSVAEHCCRVAKILKPADQLVGLMHDAAEAYLPDVAAPIKAAVGLLLRNPRTDPATGSLSKNPDRFDWVEDVGTSARNVVYFDPGLDRFSSHEARVLQAIFSAFAMPIDRLDLPASVKQADLIMLATEARDLMAEPPASWDLDVPLLPEQIKPLGADEAEHAFLLHFHKLTKDRFKTIVKIGALPIEQPAMIVSESV